MGSYNEYKDEIEDNNDYVDYTDGNGDDCNNDDENDDEDSTCRRLLAKSSQSRQGRRKRLFFNCLKGLSLRIPDICHFFTLAKFLENKIYTEKRQFFASNP